MSFRTPGYPLFIAFFLALWGNPVFISVIQIILTGLTVILLYRLSRIFFSEKISFIAGLLLALEPAFIFYSIVLLSESVFIFLLVAATYLLVKNQDPEPTLDQAKKFFVIGLLLGGATLVRPLGQLLPILFSLYFLIQLGRRLKFRHLKPVLALGLGFILIVGPWLVRNKTVFDQWQLSSFGPYNLYDVNFAMHYVYENDVGYQEARAVLRERVGGPGPDPMEFKSFSWMKTLQIASADYLKNNFWSYTKFHLVKTIPFFITDGLREVTKWIALNPDPLPNVGTLILKGQFSELRNAFGNTRPSTIMFFSGLIFWVVVNFLILVGFLKSLFVKNRSLAWFGIFCLLLIFYFAIITGPAAMARFRLPAEPFMFILAAFGGATAISWLKRKPISKKNE